MATYKTYYNLKCNECKSKPLIKDLKHDLIFCGVCGLVHENNIIPIMENANYLELTRMKINNKLFFFKKSGAVN